MKELKQKEAGVTLKAILISLILIPLNCFWVITGEMKMGGNYMLPTFIVPFYNVIFCLFVLSLLSSLLERYLPSLALSQGELLTVYIILSLATCLPAIHMMGYLVTGLGHLLTYATSENEWSELLIGSASGGGWADGGAGAFYQLRSFLLYPTSPDYTSISFMGIGFLFSFFLMMMRFRFVWWKFHPIGYIIANLNWGAMNFWSCLLIGSTAKWIVFKYGGAKAYSKAMRVAIGLILGGFVVGGLWNVIGFVFGMPTYSFWPGGYIWG